MLSKDGAFLEREAKRQIKESLAERQTQIIAGQKAKDAETIAPDAGFDTTLAEAQLGRPLLSSEVQKRLKKLNTGLCFERALADSSKIGIYVYDGVSNPGTVWAGRRFVLGMEAGMNPEFSVRQTDGTKITKEIRGWRTVVVRLIRERLIGREAAEVMFNIAGGRESENWWKFVN
jgi:hypothetical protein